MRYIPWNELYRALGGQHLFAVLVLFLFVGIVGVRIDCFNCHLIVFHSALSHGQEEKWLPYLRLVSVLHCLPSLLPSAWTETSFTPSGLFVATKSS